MTVKISKGKAVGKVIIPPSKSVAHRALICAAFTDGVSYIKNLPDCDDVAATLDCLAEMGVKIKVSGDRATVYGVSPKELANNSVARTLNCGESASTLRFLFPFCLILGGETTFRGSGRLFFRPLSVYEQICKEHNIKFEKTDDGITICGAFSSNFFEIDGAISSQFASGLLMALPHIKNGKIRVISPLESAPYIALTENIMSDFGYTVKRDKNEFSVCGKGKANENFEISIDMSAAAFFGAMNALGGKVEFENYREDARQGDFIYKSLFDKITSGFAEIPINDTPDLFPILSVVAGCFDGARFTGTNRLRLKESDRVAAMSEELGKCGVKVDIGDDFVTVAGRPTTPIVALDSHSDHRIAMALAVLLSKVGGKLNGAECVSKSFPSFWRELGKVGINLEFSE